MRTHHLYKFCFQLNFFEKMNKLEKQDNTTEQFHQFSRASTLLLEYCHLRYDRNMNCTITHSINPAVTSSLCI